MPKVLGMALRVGETNLVVMKMLSNAHATTWVPAAGLVEGGEG